MFGIYAALETLSYPAIWVLSEQGQKQLSEAGLQLPDHVHCTPFAPQNDLLGSPSITAFVTQGGTNSLYEASHSLTRSCAYCC